MEPLGDNNEASTSGFLILLLLMRRIDVPSRRRRLSLWGVAGLLNSFFMGSAVATALAAFHELRLCRADRRSMRKLGGNVGMYLFGLIPWFYFTFYTSGKNVGFVLEKFLHAGIWESLRVLYESLAGFADGNYPLLFLWVAAWVAMFYWSARRRSNPESLYVGIFMFVNLAAVAAVGESRTGYYLYSYSVWLFPMAYWAARLADRGRRVLSRAFFAVLALTLVALVMRPPWDWDEKNHAELLVEDGQSRCFSRVGRAIMMKDPYRSAVEVERDVRLRTACASLGGSDTLDCLSGIAYEKHWLTGLGGEEAKSFAFGWGRAAAGERDLSVACARFNAPDERRTCYAGGILECLAYGSYSAAGTVCKDIAAVPFPGYFRRLRERALNLPPGEERKWKSSPFAEHERPGCAAVLKNCM